MYDQFSSRKTEMFKALLKLPVIISLVFDMVSHPEYHDLSGQEV